MRRNYKLAGAIVAIIGVSIFFLAIIKVPFATIESVEVTKSDIWLVESFTVPALSYKAYNGTFYSERTLHITFNVTAGENEDIDFWVLNETEFWKFEAGESYEFYTEPSRSRVTTVEIEWNAPTDQKIYFVWDNSFSSVTSKSVSADFYFTWKGVDKQKSIEYRTLFPTEVSYLGVLLFFGGLAMVGYELHARSRI